MNDTDPPNGHGLLSGTVSYGLKRASRRVIRDLEEALRPHDVTPPLLAALSIAAARPGIAPAHLAEAMGHGRSRAAPLLDRLEARGWLERRAGADRRSLGLHATAEGEEALRRIQPLLEAHERRTTAQLDAAEARLLVSLLERLMPGG